MIDISKGRFWDRPWSLVDGCTPCSPGCERCWALAMEKRFHKGPAVQGKGVHLHPERLSIPLKRRKPTVFSIWNDLFHEAVPFKFIVECYSVMLNSPQHTFLVLTKRPERMASMPQSEFPNIWHGLTVCNQEEADQKIPAFLRVPGKKFLSIEPMLGPVDISDHADFMDDVSVVAGGETGIGARPLNPHWIRMLRGQCIDYLIPFFFKQWGEWLPADQRECPPGPPRNAWMWSDGTPWGGHCNIQEMTINGLKLMKRVGRKAAGRLLDGRTHDELAWR